MTYDVQFTIIINRHAKKQENMIQSQEKKQLMQKEKKLLPQNSVSRENFLQR